MINNIDKTPSLKQRKVNKCLSQIELGIDGNILKSMSPNTEQMSKIKRVIKDDVRGKLKHYNINLKRFNKISELSNSNNIFCSDYKKFQNKIEVNNIKSFKENPFKELISQYTERGDRIPNFASKKNNLFKPSTLLMENDEILENHILTDEDKGKDSLFLTKIQKITDEKLSSIILDYKNKYDGKDKLYRPLSPNLNYLKENNNELKEKLRNLKITANEIMNTEYEFEKTTSLNTNRKSISTIFTSHDISRIESNRFNSVHKLPNIDKSPILKSEEKITLKIPQKINSKNMIVLRNKGKNFFRYNRESLIIDNLRRKDKEHYLDYIYKREESRNFNFLVNDYCNTFCTKKADEDKVTFKNNNEPYIIANFITDYKKCVELYDISENIQNNINSIQDKDQIRNIQENVNRIKSLDNSIKNLDKILIKKFVKQE